MSNQEQKLSFENPDVFKYDTETGTSKVDHTASEVAVRMEALGRPVVHYLGKANRYYKDAACNVEFSDSEVQALGLPIPAEIESKRKKMRQSLIDSGKYFTEEDAKRIILETSPKTLDYPEDIKRKLIPLTEESKLERDLQRLNRSVVGK